jgi:hypothetical protein
MNVKGSAEFPHTTARVSLNFDLVSSIVLPAHRVQLTYSVTRMKDASRGFLSDAATDGSKNRCIDAMYEDATRQRRDGNHHC